MTTNLGKRKRHAVEPEQDRRQSSEESDSIQEDAQAIFRRHFEAQFKPLPELKRVAKIVEEEPEDDSEEDSEWDGISDEDGGSVQVVEHSDAQTRMAAMSKEQLKAFMVCFRGSHILLLID